MTLADVVGSLLGRELPVAITTWDGGRIGPADPPAVIAVRSPDALTRILHAPGELGFARAYVAGDIEVEGDLFAVLDLPQILSWSRPRAEQWLALARHAGRAGLLRRLPPPAEESRLHGRRHSPERDREAIAHHYDVSNEFYRLLLGPTMTYSCAVWATPETGLDAAQDAKHDLICAKLDLQPGQRLLDIGCGWGALIRRAATRYGASATGVTLSERQRAWAEAELTDGPDPGEVTVRRQDYRDVDDGPYQAVASVGMFEHVGESRLRQYFERIYRLLAPGGRLLNHGISALPGPPLTNPTRLQALRRSQWYHRLRPGFDPNSFVDRYIFPDGELLEVGSVISVMQQVGFEVRHVESLREHYGLTIRAWLDNLDRAWDEAVATVGVTRCRIWRLYLAGSVRTFESGRTGIHQVLAVKPAGGSSGMPLRPDFT